MWPEIFRFEILNFEIPLRSFGLLVAFGFLAGFHLFTKLSPKYLSEADCNPQKLSDVGWWVLIGVIVGGRLGFVVVNAEWFASRPLEIFKIWEGGLVMYGGFILAAFFGVKKAKHLGMNSWRVADVGLTAGFLGQAIGRVGCLCVGDDFGAPTDIPWAITFPDPLPQGSAFPATLAGVPVHPTQIYMSLKALSLCLLGLWLLPRKRFHGQVFLILIAGYAALRYVVEMFRYDSVARGGIFKPGKGPQDVVNSLDAELLLSTSQIVGIATFLIATLIYIHLARSPAHRIT
ncbi:MAG TPA: hypothetical protein DDW23_01680 [Planctomycetes bacterium]|nr:hypothetical protein [Planctomycetota bacterium]